MKIRMNFGALKTIILVVIILGALAIFGLDISMLADSTKAVRSTIAISIVSLIAALVIVVLALLVLLNSYYKISNDYFKITLGFMTDRIKKDDLISIVENKSLSKVFLITKGIKTNDHDYQITINIKNDNNDKFIDFMKETYPNVLYELTSNEEDKGENK